MPEKKRILKMIEEGKISAVEGLELLERLETLELEEEKNKNIVREGRERVQNSFDLKQAKFLRIKIEEKDGENLNLKLPLFLLKVGSKIFRKKIEAEIGKNKEINIDEIFSGIKNGLIGPIIDLETEEEKILITLE